MTWEQFLAALQTPGTIQIVVGAVVFALAEYVPGFVKAIEEPKWKRLVVGGISLAIPIAAYALQSVTVTHVPITWDGTWAALWAALETFGVATLIHTTKLESCRDD